jgi:hypothetical protein
MHQVGEVPCGEGFGYSGTEPADRCCAADQRCVSLGERGTSWTLCDYKFSCTPELCKNSGNCVSKQSYDKELEQPVTVFQQCDCTANWSGTYCTVRK